MPSPPSSSIVPPRPALPLAVLLLAALQLAALAGCGGEGGEGGRGAGHEDAPHAGTGASASLPEALSAQDHPAVARRRGGGTFVAYQRWDGERDTVEIRPLPEVDHPGTVVHRSSTRVLGTALSSDRDDTLHVVWSEQEGTGFLLREARVGVAGDAFEIGESTTVVAEPGASLVHPRLVADPDGRLLLLWQQLDASGQAIFAALFDTDHGWGAPQEISAGGRSHWMPDGVATGSGSFAVVWDAAVDGDYDVHLARVEAGEQGTLTVRSRDRVTDGPRLEAQPSVAVAGDRLYVAYHVGPENWGREGSENKLEVTLHGQRFIEIVAVEDRTVAPLAVSFLDGINEALATDCEQPRVHVDGAGNLVLFFRGLPVPPDLHDPMDPEFQKRIGGAAGGKGWRTSIWFTYWSAFDGREWRAAGRHHVGVAGSEGRCDAPVALTDLSGGGLGFAVVGDGRSQSQVTTPGGGTAAVDAMSWWKPVTSKPTRVTTGRIRRGPPAAAIELGDRRPLLPLRPEPERRAPAPGRTLRDGRKLQLALGDLHRHTDLSRCSSNWDGPFSDAFRYALDIAPLDFLAVTDHFEHMTAYDWWRTTTQVEVHDVDGRLVNLHAYERADAWTGHRNVISEEPPPLIGYRKSYEPMRDDGRADEPHELWELLDEGSVVTIPHTPAGMFANSTIVFHWRRFEPAFDRLVEVWQGYRGSSEAADAPRAIQGLQPKRYVLPNLANGMHFGLVAASDHQSSNGAFAGAWVEALDREGVFEALYDRRTFAATARMSLWAEWNGVLMGTSARHAAGAGRFEVEVDGFGRELRSIDLMVDGELLDTQDASGTSGRFGFELDVPAEGERFAYARVQFADGELGWTSPIRLGDVGWNGPDGLDGEEALGPPAGRSDGDADRR